MESVTSLDISQAADEVACVSSPTGRIFRFAVVADLLQPQADLPGALSRATLVCMGTGGFFAAEPGGALALADGRGEDTRFGQDTPWRN